MSSLVTPALPPALGSGPDSLLGERIGRYVISRELARGGMGVVYEAVHESIGHRAAVKVLAASLSRDRQAGDYAGRFFDEARAVNIVQHPGIVKIFDFGTLRDETVYIMMEYLEGESLWDRQRRIVYRQGQRFPFPDVLRLARLIASSLAAAHDKRIVHRDLKPENVIIVPDPDVPGGERTKVLDFGIARFMDSAQRRTVTGMVMGTAMYMAPEQCRGTDQLDGKVDVYALGVIMYELLAGRLPFEGDPGMVMIMQVTQQPKALWELVPGLPEPVYRLVHAMLAKKPAERITMAEVVARIQQIEAGLGLVGALAPHVGGPHSATAGLPALSPPLPNGSTQLLGSVTLGRPARWTPVTLLAAAVLALVVAASALWGWLGSTGTGSPQRAAAPTAAAPAAPDVPQPLRLVSAIAAPADGPPVLPAKRHKRGMKQKRHAHHR